jgi:hypothetical protein
LEVVGVFEAGREEKRKKENVEQSRPVRHERFQI